MATHSITMLRKHNQNIKVVCLCIEDLELPEHLNIEKIRVKNLGDFFFTNKEHLSDLNYEEVLYIDSDTFIFGDIEKVFEYDADFVGCENNWCYSQGFNLFRPANGGVLLFKNKAHNKIYANFTNRLFSMGLNDPDLDYWIRKTKNEWTREEFLASQLALDLGLKTDFFKPEHCRLLQWTEDFLRMKESIIFHTFTPQWELGLKHSNV